MTGGLGEAFPSDGPYSGYINKLIDELSGLPGSEANPFSGWPYHQYAGGQSREACQNHDGCQGAREVL